MRLLLSSMWLILMVPPLYNITLFISYVNLFLSPLESIDLDPLHIF